MADTPKRYLDALEMVTARKPKSAAAQPETVSLHQDKVRTAFEDSNIVGIGISEKVTEKSGTGELCLCFYVVKKKSMRSLSTRHMIPPVVAVRDGTSVFTDVKVIGKIRPQAINKRVKPLRSGYSACHYDDGAGTLGAVVRKDGKLYILSNSHVLAKAGKAKKGDAILYPSQLDGGDPATHKVATLTHFKPFVTGGVFDNRTDAALAEITAERKGDIDYRIEGADSPLRTAKATRGMKVVKVGRTSGKTESEVVDANFRVVVDYPGVGEVAFLDQVLCENYTAAGDSGSIVVAKDSGHIVGLHFAGSSQGSIFSPIDYVTEALDFSFTSS